MPRVRITRGVIALAVAFGALLGLGFFTFDYAAGTSYLSNDPKACVNCHIMRDEYNGWTKSSHHAVATCNDCHVPPHFPAKYIAKSRNGWNHSRAFTMQDFPEPIMITRKNAEILQDNCLRCHGDFVHEIVPGSSSPTDPHGVQCVHCHATVGHGPRTLAGREGAQGVMKEE
jgi:cytochrome c nitrite reductase small subunit